MPGAVIPARTREPGMVPARGRLPAPGEAAAAVCVAGAGEATLQGLHPARKELNTRFQPFLLFLLSLASPSERLTALLSSE